MLTRSYTANLQRRNCRANCCLVCFPFLICLLFGGTQLIVILAYRSSGAHKSGIDCGYCAASTKSSIQDRVGGLDCPIECPLPIASKWPPVMQLPLDSDPDDDDPRVASTRRAKHSPARFLVTGTNRPFAESMQYDIFYFSVKFRSFLLAKYHFGSLVCRF